MLIPEIDTISPLLRDGEVDINAEKFPFLLLVNTTLLNVSVFVSIDVIFLPFNSLTDTLNPPPFVSVLSNSAVFPIL